MPEVEPVPDGVAAAELLTDSVTVGEDELVCEGVGDVLLLVLSVAAGDGLGLELLDPLIEVVADADPDGVAKGVVDTVTEPESEPEPVAVTVGDGELDVVVVDDVDTVGDGDAAPLLDPLLVAVGLRLTLLLVVPEIVPVADEVEVAATLAATVTTEVGVAIADGDAVTVAKGEPEPV